MTTCTARRSGLAGYTIDRCRCPACGKAQRDYCNRRNRLLAYDQWEPYVDAGPARRHVRGLMEAGVGWQHIARMTGVANGAVSRLLYGDQQRPPSRRIRPVTAAKLLALELDLGTFADGAQIDATRTRRQIQGLVAIGWTLTEQSSRVGWSVSNYQKLSTARLVVAGTARAVDDMHRELSGTPAPDSVAARRARSTAARHGWAPPAAWDDETIDDPSMTPDRGGDGVEVVDEVAIRRVIDGEARYGDLRPVERQQLIRDHARRVPNLAKRIGMSGGQYKRWVAELCEEAA